jgi:fluoroquinolone transport system permease protein
MKTIRAIRALGPIDFKNVKRDPMLSWMALMPIFFGFLFRWGIPWVSNQIYLWLDFNLMDYKLLVNSVFAMLIPVIFGSVIGFLLLDQRDDQTISALQVTPLALRGYFLYRISMPVILGFLGNLIMLLISGLTTLSMGELILVSISAAGLTPLYALFYASFAKNKVQGFALMKMSGLIFMPVLGAYFVPEIWQWAFAVLPPFWTLKLFWIFESAGSLWFVYFFGGLIVQGGLLWVLLKHFKDVLEQG